MMKSGFHRFLCLIMALFIVAGSLDAQQRKVSEAAKKKEKVERSYKKAYAKARKRTIKHRKDIQTDAARERMNAADKRADTYNKQNDLTFTERYFKRKRPRKR